MFFTNLKQKLSSTEDAWKVFIKRGDGLACQQVLLGF